MSKYTTGEIAKLCGVSVRTVQYYDTRSILVPSETSEGGRRLYSEEDLKRMRIICFLREAGVPISKIGELFSEEHPEKVISILLDQQENDLREEIAEGQKKLGIIENVKRELRGIKNFNLESIGDIAYIMKRKNRLRRIRAVMIVSAIPLELLEWASVILWIVKGIWWPFAVCAAAMAVFAVWVSAYYYKNVAYICPECHAVFKTRFKEMFWAYHTPKMRRLTCPHCGHRGMCIEVAAERENEING